MTEVHFVVELEKLYRELSKEYESGCNIDDCVADIELLCKKYLKEERDRLKKRGCLENGSD